MSETVVLDRISPDAEPFGTGVWQDASPEVARALGLGDFACVKIVNSLDEEGTGGGSTGGPKDDPPTKLGAELESIDDAKSLF